MHFLADNEGDSDIESHIVSDKCLSICFNREEEAAEALQQAQAIAQHYASQHEFSPEGQISSHPFYKAAQCNMNMYCIDVPVSL